MSTDYYYCY